MGGPPLCAPPGLGRDSAFPAAAGEARAPPAASRGVAGSCGRGSWAPGVCAFSPPAAVSQFAERSEASASGRAGAGTSGPSWSGASRKRTFSRCSDSSPLWELPQRRPRGLLTPACGESLQRVGSVSTPTFRSPRRPHWSCGLGAAQPPRPVPRERPQGSPVTSLGY